MGAFVIGAWMGGCGCTDAMNVLHIGGSGGATLRVGVMGHVSADWEGDGRISASGDKAVGGADATAERVRALDINSPRGGNGGGGTSGYRNLYRPSLKTVAKYILTRSIMDLCLVAGRRPGARISKWQCEQDILDLDGIREAERAADAERD